MATQVYLRAPGEMAKAPAGMDAVFCLDEAGAAGIPLHHNLAALPPPLAPGPTGALGFLYVVLGVWAADKYVRRDAAPDAWTRRLSLYAPTTPAWLELAPELAALLNFLTGDEWDLHLRVAALNLEFQRGWPHSGPEWAAMLFSGGLDSLVGAIDRLEEGWRLVLVSHADYGQLAAAQNRLAAALKEHYGPERLHHLGLRVQSPQAPEMSLRSRSLLYIALAGMAAAALGPEAAALIPENGWISLNPPLTGNRLGTLSTRTTHPAFLAQLLRLWQAAGLAHPLHNPYQDLTKGEVLEQCRNQALLKRLYPLTASCARPVASRWQGKEGGACGYCYPCLVRRAALHRLGWDAGEDYLLDVLAAPEHLRHRVRGGNLRAALLALKTWQDAPEEVMARLVWGQAAPDLAEGWARARHLLNRGFGEIGRFCRELGPAWVQGYLA